jgi:hypothetical protein
MLQPCRGLLVSAWVCRIFTEAMAFLPVVSRPLTLKQASFRRVASVLICG